MSLQSPVPHPRALCPIPVPGAVSLSFLPDATIPPCCHYRAVIYFNIQVVRGRQRVICLLQEQIANVSTALPIPACCSPCTAMAGCAPAGWALSCPGAVSVLQEGEDKLFLMHKLHSVYEQRGRRP